MRKNNLCVKYNIVTETVFFLKEKCCIEVPLQIAQKKRFIIELNRLKLIGTNRWIMVNISYDSHRRLW